MSQTLLELAQALVMAQEFPPDAMHRTLYRTYTSLLHLQAQEDGKDRVPVGTPVPLPVVTLDWQISRTTHARDTIVTGESLLDRQNARTHRGITRQQLYDALRRRG